MKNIELRDYFAGKALEGFIANGGNLRSRSKEEAELTTGEIIAKDSYSMADYMLKAKGGRERTYD